jgi:Protein of unknown function (DUF3017)
MTHGTLRGVVARQWPFLLVCVGAAAGLGVVVLLDRFRRGTLLLAGAVVLGAWLRALLPPAQVGLLRVRGRTFDVATMLCLGIALTVVALVVPPPS